MRTFGLTMLFYSGYFFSAVIGGDEHLLLIMNILKCEEKESLYKSTQDIYKERKKARKLI